MSEQDPQPQHVTAVSPAPGDLKQDEKRSSRLLLYEVLLEEYASLPQPPLDEPEVGRIKDESQKKKAEWQETDEAEREEFEKKFSAKLFKRVTELMSQAQRHEATELVKELEARYEAAYKDIEDPNEHRKTVNRAVAYEIYGVTEDIRNRFWAKHSDIADEAERTRQTEAAVSRAVRFGARKPPGPGSTGDEVADDEAKRDDDRDSRDRVIAAHAQTLRSALCLSGGGIRSATFNLGILQGLARHGLLEKFDYLSTVSGGGFTGSWLTAWIHRRGMTEVMQKLKEPPQSPLAPDPEPVEQLRVYSNYLSPRPGLLSADTWTLISMMLRNLLLTWLVFVPWLIAGLLVPRMLMMLVIPRNRVGLAPAAEWSMLGIGFAAVVWAFTYIGLSLPVSNSGPFAPNPHTKKGGQPRFILFCLVPLVVGAIALAAYGSIPGLNFSIWQYLLFAEGIIIIPWALSALKIVRNIKARKRSGMTTQGRFGAARFVKSTLSILLAQVAFGTLLWYAATTLQPLLILTRDDVHPRLYAAFSVPLLLLFLALSGTLIAGFTSRYTNDEDQEWWGRCGAWVLLVAFMWAVVNLLVLYGPSMITRVAALLTGPSSLKWSNLTWGDLGTILGAGVGIVSGIITLYGGFSNKTPPHESAPRSDGMGRKALSALTSLVAPIFLAFLVILITFGTNWLLTSKAGVWLCHLLTGVSELPAATNHAALVATTPFRYLFVAAVIIGGFGSFMGRLINTNAFSAHFIWRNRIIRAYLGASRCQRNPNPFTGFDTYDNLQMYELRPQPPEAGPVPPREGRPETDEEANGSRRKLLHVLNIALNLVGGEKLEWQDRKAESFTVSPLHSGSYWLGYRRSHEYGGQEGISLGTAVAISGAFVSPNMGYMMTSPIVRFLMTLFNVRFGWWLGNPGPAGDETSKFERFMVQLGRFVRVPVARPFQLASPRLSVIPIVQEALGQTNDKSSYVYLSDGGHFENLGLYEMVLRRCRFIVVSDASSDAQYSFDSLAMAIRQIRVDFGVPIDMPEMSITTPSQNMKNKYCAIGKIRYSCVDRDPQNPDHQKMKDEDFDGVLIYVKASMIGEEPRDVLNYGQSSNNFPQEMIVDQWFSEAQFESYRALGSHIIDAICGGSQNQVTLAAFARKVREHNQLNFRAFQEEINYAAFEHQFKELLNQHPIPSFRGKVRSYMDKLLR